MNRAEYAFYAARTALETQHGVIVLNEVVQSFNDPTNPVTLDEVLQVLADAEAIERNKP